MQRILSKILLEWMTLKSISPSSRPLASPFPLYLKVVTIITQDPLSIMQPHFFLLKCLPSPPAVPIPIFIAPSFQSGCFFRVSTLPCHFPSFTLLLLQSCLPTFWDSLCPSGQRLQIKYLLEPGKKSYLSEVCQYRKRVHFHRGMLISIVAWKQQCKNNDIELPILVLCVGEIGRDEGLVTNSRTRVP